MKRFGRFLHDQLGFMCIYILSIGIIVGFYALTVPEAEAGYPVAVAAFLLVLYMLIKYVRYVNNDGIIDKLTANGEELHSTVMEYDKMYRAVNTIYERKNRELSALRHDNRENNRFLSAYIHNLKTPVTVISIITQRVQAGELDAALAVKEIEEQTNRLSDNLNMLLDIKRLEEHTNDYNPSPVNLDEEVTKCINNNKALFINSKVYPKFEEGHHMVYTDTKWNDIVINQIISNGVKYTRGDEPKKLYFTIEEVEEHTRLIIRDEGEGMPLYDLLKAFEPFYTGENGRKGYASTGIGLYLCKKICDSLGHEISIDSNNGCIVTISYLSKL